jgi:hypothetical protein
VLVSLGSGGTSNEASECSRLGGWNDGSISLLSGVGLGCGASLDSGSVSLTVLGSGESLVGGWSLLLGSGGNGIDSSDCSRLGRPSLLKGSTDGAGLCGTSLDGCGTPDDPPGGDVGGWLEVVEGTVLSTGDGPPEPWESSEVVDSGDALGTGESLGGCGDAPGLRSLRSLGVVSDVCDDGSVDGVGLVMESGDASEPGDCEGSVTLDGPCAEDASPPELG